MNIYGYAHPLHFQAMKSFTNLINISNNSDIPPSILCIPCLESTRRQCFQSYRSSSALSQTHELQCSYPRCWFFRMVSDLIFIWIKQKSSKLSSGVGGVSSQAGGCHPMAVCMHSQHFGESRKYRHGFLFASRLQCRSVVPASLIELCWDGAESTALQHH